MIDSYLCVHKTLLIRQPVQHRLGPFRARLVNGAHCVVFEADWRGGKFLGISRVRDIREIVEDNRVIQFPVFDEVQAFDRPRDLRALAGSLERVRHVLEPQRHFSRSILKLSRHDFFVIKDNRADVSASVFRYLFAALPMEMQADFLQQEGVDLEKFYGDGPNALDGLDVRLNAFFDKNLTPSLDLVRSLAETYNQVQISGAPGIGALCMTDGNGEGNVPLGRIAQDVTQLLVRNGLFSEGPTRPRLLDEIPRQVADAGKGQGD